MISKPNRYTSKQDYGTPPDFLQAVKRRFGRLDYDLAARADNTVAPVWFSPESNSLVRDWTSLRGNLWLNPPFADVAPWASKCARSKGPGRRIIMLTPAAVSTEWFADYVFGHALVLAIRPKLQFVGARDPFFNGLILSVYDAAIAPAFGVWRWDR